jgi:hypothetical protein
MVDKTQYINIYNAQFGHNPPPAATPSDTAGGITAYNGNVPLYTVIFLKTKDPHGNVINNTFYQNTTIHEAGHWGDIYLAPIAGAGLVRASDAPLFQHGLNTDWGLFNPLTNCSTMVPSVFNGFQDPSGTWFCNGINGTGGSLQAPYTGLSNEAVLQAPTAFQEIFAVNKEIYAEANAILTGVVDGTTMGLDHFFTDGPAPGQGRFACTKLFVQKLIVNGRLPTAQELQHINCPTQ